MPFKPLKQIGVKDGGATGAKKDMSNNNNSNNNNSKSGNHSVTPSPLESTASATGEAPAPKLPPKPVREQVRVIYAYKAQNEDELTIKEGDIITVIAKDSEDAGWWKGELAGRIALFPDNFVEVVQPSPPPPLPRPAGSTATTTPSTTGSEEKVSKEQVNRVGGKKPDRAPVALPSSAASNQVQQHSSASNASTTSTTANNNSSNAFSSVPIIGKMLKFGGGASSAAAANTSLGAHSSSPSSNNNNSSYSSSVTVNANGFGKANNNSSDNANAASSPADDSSSDLSFSKEDPFNAGEPLSPSKLVHLTAQRPKIPGGSRRPPSMHLGKSSGDSPSLEYLDGGLSGGEDSPNILSSESQNNHHNHNHHQSAKSKEMTNNNSATSRSANISASSLKPVPPKPASSDSSPSADSGATSSPEKKAPWLSDLKKVQERRRTQELNKSSNDESSTSPSAGATSATTNPNRKSVHGSGSSLGQGPAPSAKPHAPTPPGGKPSFVSSKPTTLLQTQTSLPTGSSTTEHHHQHTSATSSSSNTNNTTEPATSPLTSASKSVIQNLNSPSEPYSPTAINGENNNNSFLTESSKKHHFGGSTKNSKITPASDESDELIKMRSEVAELRGTVSELKGSLGELRRELATANAAALKATANTSAELTAAKALFDKQVCFHQALFFAATITHTHTI